MGKRICDSLIRLSFFYAFYCLPLTAGASITDTLRVVGKDDLIACSWHVYFQSIRGSDSATAFRELDQMRKIARERGSSYLNTCAEILAGKYSYDRHYWKNQQPLVFFKKAYDIGDYPACLKAEILYSIGIWYYFAEHNYPLAFENLLQAQTIAEETGFRNIPDADELLCNLGVAHFQFGEYEKAIKYLNLARQQPVSKERNRIEIYNNLGIVYRDLDRYDSAARYFNIALQNAVALKNEAWVGIISGNLGSVYYKLHDYRDALVYLYKDYDLSTKNRQTNSAANAVLLIAQIYFENGNIDSAQLMLQKGRELAFKCNDPRIYILLYRNLTRFYKHKGDIAKALNYTDSMIVFKDSVAKRNNVATLEKARNKIETETHLANIRLLESKKNRQILVRNGLLGIAALLLVIVWQIFRRKKLRQQKNMEIMELKQKRSYEELQNARSLLDSYVDTLKQKNQMLEQFASEIEQLHNLPGSPISDEKEEILKRLQDATILTEEDWLEFKKLFTKVHSAFFMRLHEKFPNLTQAETRILALSKLGLSTKEKANMLGISPDSVRRTQQRLHKKIGLTEVEIFEELALMAPE